MKILILGGTGYIGGALYDYFSPIVETITVDLEWFGNPVNPSNIKQDYRYCSRAFLKKFDGVILMAGHSSVQMCRENMGAAFRNNVVNFVDLLDKIDDQLFIYASSSSVYGNITEKFVDESFTSYTPHEYYDLTKQEIDLYTKLSKKNCYGLRLGTVNGGAANLRTDVMINAMYHSAKIRGEIQLFNGDALRPILGINDLCRAILYIIEKQSAPGLYNLSSFVLTAREIASETAKILDTHVVNLRPDEVNNSKLHTSQYNFSINSGKFEQTFDFQFKDDVESIVKTLDATYAHSKKTDRRLQMPY